MYDLNTSIVSNPCDLFGQYSGIHVLQMGVYSPDTVKY